MSAISEADLVLFLVDAKSGRLPGDHDIARLLRTQNKPVVLVANKIDGQNSDYIEGEFAELGVGGLQLGRWAFLLYSQQRWPGADARVLWNFTS